MSIFDKNVEAFRQLKPTFTNKRLGKLGKYNDDGSVNTDISAGLTADYSWVRFNDDRAANRVKNLRVRREWGTPVWVEYNELTKEDEVREVHSVLAPAIYGGEVAAALNSAAIPANVSTPVRGTDLEDLAVRPDTASGGLTVRILSGWAHGEYHDGSELLTLIPTATSSKTAFVCVGIDSAGDPVQTLSTDRAVTYPFFDGSGVLTTTGATDIQTVMDAAPTTFWLWAFLLSEGAITIDLTKQQDLRLWQSPGSSGGTTTTAITLYHADGSDPETFTVDATGLDDASAAAASGDVIWLPPATITGNHTLTADVEYVGIGREQTILTGQITGANNSVLRDLSITRAASSAAALIGVLLTTGTLNLYNCTVSVTNSGAGDAYAAEATGGTLNLHECVVGAFASTGTGIGDYSIGGAIYQYGGSRDGSDIDGMLGSLAPLALAANGTNQSVFPNIISPSAYTYNGVTYVVWLGASFGTYINAYDHATRTWAGAELVRSNPGSFDDHSTPSVIVDDSGYIHVFFGGNATASLAMYHSQSTNPEDISAWTNQSNIGSSTTYHSAVKLADGEIYVFYTKASGFLHTYYVRSSESYGTEHLAHSSGASGDSIYFGNPVYDEARGRIWLMWTYYEISVTARRYLFVSYLNLADDHWYGGMDDADLGATTTTAEWVASCELLGSSYEVNHPNLFLDGSGNLHIEYNVKDGGVWKHAYRKWDGSSWGSIELITTANHQFNMGDIWVNTDGTVDAYLVTNASAVRGGNLDHWRRSVGGSWALVRTVFDESISATHDGVMYPTVNRSDTSGVVRVVFADEENTPTSNDLNLYVLNADDAYVTTIPNAYLYLYGVQTIVSDMDTPLAGDRAAFSVIGFPTLHADDLANSTPKYHVPTPTAAGKTLQSVSDGAGGHMWSAITPTTAQYQQFVYTVGGGTFAFVTDGSGNPIFAWEDVA